MLTVIFTASDTFVSKAIRYFSGGRVSHVEIGLNIYNTPMVLQSTIGGVQLETRQNAIDSNSLFAEYIIKPNLIDGIKSGFDHLGEHYDYPGLFGYLWVLTGRWLKQKWNNPLASSHAWVCSEFVAHCDINNQLPEWHKYADSGTTPEDLLKACESNPKDFELIKK
jgi:hypothetical protein